ncbi:hypothetical protein SAY87_028627 [Trapa incisa]|uniref:Uncharacterized protein n=1 Tax=Trapa incisa TaxID=236973 RepID=A0AAN7KPI6_9MYRT|nr:hypothetical protein SAY87_028627 [Trapa incisa]
MDYRPNPSTTVALPPLFSAVTDRLPDACVTFRHDFALRTNIRSFLVMLRWLDSEDVRMQLRVPSLQQKKPATEDDYDDDDASIELYLSRPSRAEEVSTL